MSHRWLARALFCATNALLVPGAILSVLSRDVPGIWSTLEIQGTAGALIANTVKVVEVAVTLP